LIPFTEESEPLQPSEPQPSEPLEPSSEVHRYLIAVDGSEASGQAFFWGWNQLENQKDPSRCHVSVVHFLPKVNDTKLEASEHFRQSAKEMQDYLKNYSSLFTKIGIPNETYLVETENDVKEGLCDFVKQKNIHTLILGTSGKSTLQRIFLGSVSEYCLRNSPCTVVVCKNPPNYKFQSMAES